MYAIHEVFDLHCDLKGLTFCSLDELRSSHVRSRGDSALGRAAHRLLQMVCGPGGIMVNQNRRWMPAFASLLAAGINKHGADMNAYMRWLDNVSDRGFADELVVAATAQLLSIAIRAVPCTPATCQSSWSIAQHPCASVAGETLIGDNMFKH